MVLNKGNNEIQACKISKYSLDDCTNILRQSIECELNIISELNFPSIIKLIGYNLNDFKNRSRPIIITELAQNKSLDIILNLERQGLSNNEWNDTKKLINIYGIAAGMAYIHSHGILHRDLKPGNIFIDEYLFPKIGDFGLSKKITGDSIKEKGKKGTVPYMSPEILRDFEYTKAGDVYAFAFVAYEIMTNRVLYENLNEEQIYIKLLNYERPELTSDIPQCYKELIQNCWCENPKERYSFNHIVELLKSNSDFITDTIDQDEFYNYVDFVDGVLLSDESNQLQLLSNTFQKSSIDIDHDESPFVNNPSLEDKFLNLSEFEKGEIIIKGKTFKIYQVTHKKTGKIYSAKIITIKLRKMSRNEIINLSHEIDIISSIIHPCILKFVGYSPTDFLERNRPVIVTELASKGTLSEILNKKKKNSDFDDTMKLINIYGIAIGMSFLHSHEIIHRNLIPESIFFVNDNLYPKIGNFGVSIVSHTQESMTFQSTIGVKGSPFYSAPEVLEMNDYSKKSDVYSFGLIVYEIMTNEVPYENINGLNDFNEIVLKSKRPEFKVEIEECYRQLIECCWSQDPNDRPTFQNIVNLIESDERFITGKVNRDKFHKYLEFIDNSYVEHKSGQKIFQQDNLIKEKSRIKEVQSESSDEEEDNEKIDEEKIINEKIDESTEDETNEISTNKINEINQDDLSEKSIFVEHDNDNYCLIEGLIASKKAEELMDFLNNECDIETTSSAFNLCLSKSPEIYPILCEKGISLNNAVAYHKHALYILSKIDEANSRENRLKIIDESRSQLEMSIKLGFNFSYFSLARLTYEVLKDNKLAFDIASAGTKSGDKYSKCLLGFFKAHGIGTEKSHQEGVKMILESGAIELFDNFATDIGIYYASCDQKDNQKAFEFFEKAFNIKKTKATINNLGICFLKGIGVEKNIDKAKEIFSLGANKGDQNAIYHLNFIIDKF